MPELMVTIGEREFAVACQEGEEAFLQAAARMLDIEAAAILEQVGRMPTERMLLMAGLMLADKTASLEEDLAARTEALAAAEQKASDQAQQALSLPEASDAVAVPEIPPEIADHLEDLAARAEALAGELEGEASEG